jgi:monovalent cation:H+ antiporter-2, CPA2 family
MHDLSALQDVLILLVLALANAWLFSRMRQSPIVGYLTTGLLVGPYGFHLIKGVHEVEMVAEIGVVLLLFTIGLEFSYKRIVRLKKLLLSAGTMQVTCTFLAVTCGTYLLGEPLRAAVVLGMAMALSSTAIVLKLLLERGEIDSAHGRIALAILLFQDICVIVFIVALPLLSAQAESFSLWGILRSAIILGGLYLFVRHLLKPLLRAILQTRAPELFRLTILALVLGTAWVTAHAGLSLALGAFLAGLALAESDSSHQVMADIIPFRDVFLAVFFISVGMLVDIRLLIGNFGAVLIGIALLSLAKVMAGTGAGLVSRYPLHTAMVAGLMIFQVGEFSFILLAQARTLELIPPSTYQLALSIIALSMMLTPMVFRFAQPLSLRIARLLGRYDQHSLDSSVERTANLEGHVIIAGYGLAGKNVARTLRDMRLPYIHIEMNGEVVRQARKTGEIILHGDATAAAVLEAAGILRARAMVLAINDPSALARAIPAARELNSELYILARTHYVTHIEPLMKVGADDIITDEFSSGLEMAAFLLQAFKVPEGRVLKILSALRKEHQQRYQPDERSTDNLTGYLSVLDGGEIEIHAVPDNSPCIGKTLAELDFRARTGVTVMGVIRSERVIYSPTADLCLATGDTLMLLGDDDNIRKARDFLNGLPT